MKIELSISEASLLMEVIRDWQKTKVAVSIEHGILNGIKNKFYDGIYHSSEQTTNQSSPTTAKS